MANITFSSPEYKNKTVYAVAGSHTETILKIAKTNHIPIDFSCEDGQCGTCVIKVTVLSDKQKMGCHLSDKEQTVLKEVGKLTQKEIDRLVVDDIPSQWRLACQMIVRDEDVLVEYGG